MITVHVRVGPYESSRRLAIGGMSEVFLATDQRDGRVVALKISRSDPELRELERRGAVLQRHLSEIDTRVPRVFEIGEQDGTLYVAMEYVEGEDLADRIARGPMEPREALRVAIELCELLAKAHALSATLDGRVLHGMVHGDLKPKNVRLEAAGAVKVLDFGIAKALSLSRKLTRNEFLSLPYCSPERIDSGLVDAHADLWAAGIVLHEMLTGNTPHGFGSTQQLENAIRSRRPLPPLPAGMPPGLDAVLARALAPQLERRYPTAEAFRNDLYAVKLGRPPEAASVPIAPAGYEATRRSVPSPNGTATADEVTRRTTAKAADEEDSNPLTIQPQNGPALPSATSGSPSLSPPMTPPLASPPAPGPASTTTRKSLPSKPVLRPLIGRPWPLWKMGPMSLGMRLRWVAVLLLFLLGLNEAAAFSDANRLRASLPRLSRADDDRVWDRYQQVRRRSRLGIAAFRLDRGVRRWFVGEADALIADYRSDYPTIREAGWREAASLLGRASSIGEGDDRIEARRLYVDGHLARIRGQARAERPAQAQAQYDAAIRAFQESARRWERWPDPWLGMARTYAYGLEDYERAEESLAEAKERGLPMRSREIAMLADGHRHKARRLWADVATVDGTPQESRYLDAIQESCEKALELYAQVPGFGEVPRHVRDTQALLEQVQERRPVPWFLQPFE